MPRGMCNALTSFYNSYIYLFNVVVILVRDNSTGQYLMSLINESSIDMNIDFYPLREILSILFQAE